MVYISERLRKQVEDRAGGCCEYCQTDRKLLIHVEIDHIIPLKADGPTTLENLCFTCHACNNAKQDFRTGVDPETGEEIPLFNPRLHNWDDHFTWSDDKLSLVGLTPTGRATIIRLQMNREDIVVTRRLWIRAGYHPSRNNPLLSE